MSHQFLVDTYATERLKVLSVWSMFRDGDLPSRPRDDDTRGRSLLEQMIHQCMSENGWFVNMLGIDVGAPPLPDDETRSAFIARYATDSARREQTLRTHTDPHWWEEEVNFFEVSRSRAWVMVRRIAHTAHHRGQQTGLLRALRRDLHSTYGPSADTGGLPVHMPAVVYPYPDEKTLLAGGQPAPLPGPGSHASTERPGG